MYAASLADFEHEVSSSSPHAKTDIIRRIVFFMGFMVFVLMIIDINAEKALLLPMG